MLYICLINKATSNIIFEKIFNEETFKKKDISTYLLKYIRTKELVSKKGKFYKSYEYFLDSKHIFFFLAPQKSNYVLVTIFFNSTPKTFCKAISYHIYLSYFNFCSIVERQNELYKKLLCSIDNITMIYYTFYLVPLIENFYQVFSNIRKTLSIIFTSTKYISSFLIDLSNNSIFYDSEFVKVTSKRFYIKKKKKLFNEIIYHCNKLKEEYIKENDYLFSKENFPKYFLKLECRATYPRLIFVIKFFPILNGIAFINFYSQKKLSKVAEQSYAVNTFNSNNDGFSTKYLYKECDIIYGTELAKADFNDLRFQESQKTKRIEQFFIDHFIVLQNHIQNQSESLSNCKFFLYDDFVLKYLNKDLINPLNELKNNEEDFVKSIYKIFRFKYNLISTRTLKSTERKSIKKKKEDKIENYYLNKEKFFSYYQNAEQNTEQENSGSISQIDSLKIDESGLFSASVSLIPKEKEEDSLTNMFAGNDISENSINLDFIQNSRIINNNLSNWNVQHVQNDQDKISSLYFNDKKDIV